jgi:hypothetical protein
MKTIDFPNAQGWYIVATCGFGDSWQGHKLSSNQVIRLIFGISVD